MDFFYFLGGQNPEMPTLAISADSMQTETAVNILMRFNKI
jgi:hypothetical protein